MGRVAREVVQKAGIDVDKLLDMLVRNASAELNSPSSNSCSASTSAARMRRGLRSRHAFVLQRGVQYFLVARVFGKRLPHQQQTSITFLPFTNLPLINACKAHCELPDRASDAAAERLIDGSRQQR